MCIRDSGDGDVDPDDRVKLGDGYSPFTFGIDINLNWKDFDFRIFGQGVAGGQIYNTTRRFDLANTNYSGIALERWTGEGTSDVFPRLTDDDRNLNFSRSSDLFVENGSFFRLRNVQLGYSLGENIRKKLGLGETRVYVAANNLHTFTGYSGLEVEIIGNVDRGQYPQARTFLIGINTRINDL